MKRKTWQNKHSEISLQISEDSYEIVAEHSGHIEPARYGLPEDSSPEEVEIEIHRLTSGYKDGRAMTDEELIAFLDKYEGLIGDEILSEILD